MDAVCKQYILQTHFGVSHVTGDSLSRSRALWRSRVHTARDFLIFRSKQPVWLAAIRCSGCSAHRRRSMRRGECLYIGALICEHFHPAGTTHSMHGTKRGMYAHTYVFMLPSGGHEMWLSVTAARQVRTPGDNNWFVHLCRVVCILAEGTQVEGPRIRAIIMRHAWKQPLPLLM